jgi:Tol biopolymer transport system component
MRVMKQALALCVSALLLAVTACASASPPRADIVPTPTAVREASPVEAADGWTAFAAGGPAFDIMLVEPGEPPKRIFGSDEDELSRVCPAFAPGTARLAFGEATGGFEAGWTNAALVIADVTPGGEASVVRRIELDGIGHAPCPIWSPDGRWIAFGASAEQGWPFTPIASVWAVDTTTDEIRKLTGLAHTDIEWAPDGSELYIADESGILVYSFADGKTRTLPGTALTRRLAVSPDGRTLAVERRRINAAYRYDLLLMSTDGLDQRVLVNDYPQMHGIGPVWSPDGSRVVFQHLCDTLTEQSGTERPCAEESDVVLLTVTDDDPTSPFGTEKVIPFPRTGGGSESWLWTPYSVSWSPDGTSLLYLAWAIPDPFSDQVGYVDGLLSVSVSDSAPPVIMYEAPDYSDMAVYVSHPMNNFQSWSSR